MWEIGGKEVEAGGFEACGKSGQKGEGEGQTAWTLISVVQELLDSW